MLLLIFSQFFFISFSSVLLSHFQTFPLLFHLLFSYFFFVSFSYVVACRQALCPISSRSVFLFIHYYYFMVVVFSSSLSLLAAVFFVLFFYIFLVLLPFIAINLNCFLQFGWIYCACWTSRHRSNRKWASVSYWLRAKCLRLRSQKWIRK